MGKRVGNKHAYDLEALPPATDALETDPAAPAPETVAGPEVPASPTGLDVTPTGDAALPAALPEGAPKLGDVYVASKGRPFWYTVSMLSEGASVTNVVVKFVVESESGEKNPYGKSFPIASYPNFSLWRTGVDGQGGFTQQQDAALTGLELANATLTNIADIRDLANPPEIRTDDMVNFAFIAGNNVLEPSHPASLYRGLIASRQEGFGYRSFTFVNSATAMVGASQHWGQYKTVLETGCSPWKAENFPGGAAACDEFVESNANGSDAVLGNYFDNGEDASTSSPDVEGIEGLVRATQESAVGQYRTVYGMAGMAMFNSLEIDGRPSWYSFLGAAPLIADGIVSAQAGQPLDAGDWAQRGVTIGGAFAITALSDEKEIDVTAANNFSYALISPNYPAILEYTTVHADPLAFGNNEYDNPDSVFMLTPKLSMAGYGLDSTFAGFNSGYGLATGDGADRYLPLALNATALGLQVYANATEGSPDNWKYIGMGTLLSAAGTGLGYAAGKDTFVRKVMFLNPRVSVTPDGFGVGIGGTFD